MRAGRAVPGAPERACRAWTRHSKKPESAKNTATDRSMRPQTRWIADPVEEAVWKATWVVRTAKAAIARNPSSAGTNPRAAGRVPTRWSGVPFAFFITVNLLLMMVRPGRSPR